MTPVLLRGQPSTHDPDTWIIYHSPHTLCCVCSAVIRMPPAASVHNTSVIIDILDHDIQYVSINRAHKHGANVQKHARFTNQTRN